MNEKLEEFTKTLKCEVCDGSMRMTGEYFACNPPRYFVICDKCQAAGTIGVKKAESSEIYFHPLKYK